MRRCKAITTRGNRCKLQVTEELEFCHFHDGHTRQESSENCRPTDRQGELEEVVQVVEEKLAGSTDKSSPSDDCHEKEGHPVKIGANSSAITSRQNYLMSSVWIGVVVIFLILVGLRIFNVM